MKIGDKVKLNREISDKDIFYGSERREYVYAKGSTAVVHSLPTEASVRLEFPDGRRWSFRRDEIDISATPVMYKARIDISEYDLAYGAYDRNTIVIPKGTIGTLTKKLMQSEFTHSFFGNATMGRWAVEKKWFKKVDA
jgi:hypothetical protein